MHYIRLMILFLLVRPAGAAQPAANVIQKGIALAMTHQYESAISLFQTLQDSFPRHPAPLFYQAMVYQLMMSDMESDQWKEAFYQSLEQSLRRSEENPAGLSYRFYRGAALSYKGYQLAQDKKYWSAWTAIRQSMKLLQLIAAGDSLACDAKLGVGNYLYWRSKATSWLPFFTDKRDEGMGLVETAASCAENSFAAAWSSLSWMRLEEKKYTLAVEAADRGLERFPGSRFFLWPKAEALFRNRQWQPAKEAWDALLISMPSATPNNHYNEIVIHWKLAQCCFNLGDRQGSLYHAGQVVVIEPLPAVLARSKDKKERARKFLAGLEKTD